MDYYLSKLKNTFKHNDAVFEPFVRHIRFPFFKKIKSFERISFEFPIMVLVGPNGSNKSSILRAISCCPNNNNLGDHWFSTDIDPIREAGNRSRYIYGYNDPVQQEIVEVMHSRMKRKGDPDYWESSRPIVKDGMQPMPPLQDGEELVGRGKTRWSGIDKNVILIDFRSEISAFDRLFYHGEAVKKLRKKSIKEHLHSRSKYLKKVIDDDLKSFRCFKGRKEYINCNFLLDSNEVEMVSDIIGKKYNSIRILKHDFFDNNSFTVILSSSNITYSEAFAGSGEFAAVMLVWKVMRAKEKSLIVLDEPEVSLHPRAQKMLVKFLIEQCQHKKHQIVISSHSKYIVDPLPDKAICLLTEDSNGEFYFQQNIKAAEAFFHLGCAFDNKKHIYVEDRLAKEIVEKVLRSIRGGAALSQFEVTPFLGGASSIINVCMPTLFQSKIKNSYFILDGDQNRREKYDDIDDIADINLESINERIYSFFGTNIKLSKSSNTSTQKEGKEKKEFLKFAMDKTYFLDFEYPEKFLWENLVKEIPDKSEYDGADPKKCLEIYSKKHYGMNSNEEIDSDGIFFCQKSILAKIPDDSLSLLKLKKILEELVE